LIQRWLGPVLAGLAVALVILLAAPLINQPTKEVPPQNTEANDLSGPFSYSSAVKLAAPAVVNIYTTKVVQQPTNPLLTNPLLNRLFGGNNQPKSERLQSSLGSGVIVNASGYILTNNHVIEDADEIIVALQDGRESFATVVGADPDTDLAVLKIEMGNLPTIQLTSSQGQPEVGDVVLAIGNPYGVGQSVAMGIISATGRSHLGLSTYEDFIQTDAAINPGNSGGALINARGELVGINTAIFSRSGGSQGIGFAIPTDLADSIMLEIIEHGYVERGWLGVDARAMTEEMTKSFGLEKTQGMLITGIYRDGPAHLAGMKPGDILIAIDGEPVNDGNVAMSRIADHKPGTDVGVTIIRDGETQYLVATLINKPQNVTGE